MSADVNIDQSIIDEVDGMSDEELRLEMMKIQEKNAKRKALYQSEEFKAKRKAYFEENKDKLLAYRKRYQAKQKAILAKAKALGIDKEFEDVA